MNNQEFTKILLGMLMLMFPIWAYSQEGHPPPCTEVKQVAVATDSIKLERIPFYRICVLGRLDLTLMNAHKLFYKRDSRRFISKI
jgi:hypothetical protein